jgi:hypothetical protein
MSQAKQEANKMPEITVEEHAHYQRLALAQRLFDLYEPLRDAEDVTTELDVAFTQGIVENPSELRAQIAEAQAGCRRFDAALTEALALLDGEGAS